MSTWIWAIVQYLKGAIDGNTGAGEPIAYYDFQYLKGAINGPIHTSISDSA